MFYQALNLKALEEKLRIMMGGSKRVKSLFEPLIYFI
jgi:hypothetical protein